MPGAGSACLHDGTLEVVFPARDRGIDLIAYLDVGQGGGRFIAKPIQMKAASRQSFSIMRKYEKIHDLILAYVWNVDMPAKPETYALTYAEAQAVGQSMGWLETASWKDHDACSNTRPGERLRDLLKAHLLTPEAWLAKIATVPARS